MISTGLQAFLLGRGVAAVEKEPDRRDTHRQRSDHDFHRLAHCLLLRKICLLHHYDRRKRRGFMPPTCTSRSSRPRSTGTPATPAAPASPPAPSCTSSTRSASRSPSAKSAAPASTTGSASPSGAGTPGRPSRRRLPALGDALLLLRRRRTSTIGTSNTPRRLHWSSAARAADCPASSASASAIAWSGCRSPIRQVRSLNLSTSVGVAAYEVLRQWRRAGISDASRLPGAKPDRLSPEAGGRGRRRGRSSGRSAAPCAADFWASRGLPAASAQ